MRVSSAGEVSTNHKEQGTWFIPHYEMCSAQFFVKDVKILNTQWGGGGMKGEKIGEMREIGSA